MRFTIHPLITNPKIYTYLTIFLGIHGLGAFTRELTSLTDRSKGSSKTESNERSKEETTSIQT
jgi:hypothetical protein